jgi:AsmA family
MAEAPKKRKWPLITGIVVAVLLILVLAAPFFVDVDHFRPLIQSKLSESLGRTVQIGHLDLSLLRGRIQAEAITIGDDRAFSREPFLRAKSLAVGTEMWPLLLHRQLHVDSLNVDSPDMRLLRSPGGKWNFESLGGQKTSSADPADEAGQFSVKKLTITNGHVTLGRSGGGPTSSLSDVSIDLNNIAPGATIPLAIAAKTASGGSVKMSGTVGPLSPNASIDRAPVHLKFTAQELPARDVQGILEALGTDLPRGSSLDSGTITANLSSDGPLDRLVTTGPVAVTGVKLSGFDFASNLGMIAKLSGLTTSSNTEIENMSSHLRVAPEGIRAEQISIVIPALGTVTGVGTVSPQNRLDFHMVAKLNPSISALGALVKIPGMALGSGDIPFRIQGTTSNPTFIPEMGGSTGNALDQSLQNALPDKAKGLSGIVGGFLGKKKPPQ